MTLLAIDTAANFCAACLWDESHGKPIASVARDIGRGHAEQLISVIDDVLHDANHTMETVNRIAVSVGPGTFTGIRVGVAAAQGYGFALDTQIVGVTTLEALADDYLHMRHDANPFAVAVHGGRGQIFAQHFEVDGKPTDTPFVIETAENQSPIDTIDQRYSVIIGNAAPDIDGSRASDLVTGATASIEAFARVGLHSQRAPHPVYMRGADAKVQKGFALPRANAAK